MFAWAIVPRRKENIKCKSTDVDENPPSATSVPMLPKVDPLPCPERQSSRCDGDTETRGGQSALHVGRHIVWAFCGMGEEGIALGNEPSEPSFEVTAGGGVRVLLNDQARGGVLDEDGAEPLGYSGCENDLFDIGRNLDEALAGRLDR